MLKGTAVLLALALGLSSSSLVSAAETTVVSISAPDQVNTGETFTVSIAVTPNSAIAGVQFDLSFDPSLVTANRGEEGGLLAQDGANTYFNPGTIDNVAGTISGVAGAIISPGQTVSTPGTFAIITLTAGTTGGTVSLTLSNVVIGDIAGQSVPVSVVSGEVTINQTPAGGGGGGGGGGGSDTRAPVISDIETYDITKTTAIIRWKTNERTTSQLEYWASPHQFSALDETPLIFHKVYLTDLNPGTTYYYQTISEDFSGNGSISEEMTFTTLGTPAAFTTSALSISPFEAESGESLTISVLVTNTGEGTGTYEATLRIDNEIVASQEVSLVGSVSQEIIFTTSRDSAGTYNVDVNGVTGSFVVKEAATPEALAPEAPAPEAPVPESPELNITTSTVAFPRYDTKTDRLASVTISYEVNNDSETVNDAELILKASVDGEPVEEFSLFSRSRLVVGITRGSRDYVPSKGWQTGTYSFQTNLYVSGKYYATTTTNNLVEVRAESAVPVTSWALLGAMIGLALISIAGTVFVLLRRERFRFGA